MFFSGAEAFGAEVPLVVKLKISRAEAERIGCAWMSIIGIPYDVPV